MDQTVLRAERIYSGYGKLQVINGVDIYINEGELEL
jgi:ABC-type branched-subunit amino acid transport system ATPase component